MTTDLQKQAEELAGPHDRETGFRYCGSSYIGKSERDCDCSKRKRVAALLAVLQANAEEVERLKDVLRAERGNKESIYQTNLTNVALARAAEAKVAELEASSACQDCKEYRLRMVKEVAQAHERGVREGMEEAAKVADRWGADWAAKSIRALLSPAKPPASLAGLAPDFTDGQESAAYIKDRWGRGK
jgi:hypothetical protein